MNAMYDVVTIGSTTRDAFFSADFKTIPWPKTPSRSAYVLPRGEKIEVKNIYFTMGGNAANAAVTFVRQGFRAAAVGKTGRDVSGEEIRRKLKKENIETKYMSYAMDTPTAYSVLLLENGERTILGYHGASDTFTIRDVRLAALRARWWYVSLAGESDKMFKPLMAFARKNKIAVAFNPSGHHIKHCRSEILAALKDISFLVVNDEEAALLAGIPWKREKEVFKKLNALISPGILAVTTGPAGVTVSDGAHIYKAGTFKEKKLVDRTGAGDAFGAGFTAGLLWRQASGVKGQEFSKDDIIYAIRLATANATANVEEVGATEGLLTKKEFNAPRWKKLKISVKKL